MGTYAIIENGVVTNTVIWDGVSEYPIPEGSIIVATDVASIGWTYVNGEFIPPPIEPPTDAQVIAANTAFLQQATQLSVAQKTALANRIGTLNDAIELEMATPEEVAELPVRQAQLLDWKRYAVFLGRVTLQSGWALTVSWPAQPTDGVDLTVSAVAPDSLQLQ